MRLFVFVLVATLSFARAASAFCSCSQPAGYNGVCTAADVQSMVGSASGSYWLCNDVDLTSVALPGGFTFTGVFDGNFHTLSSITRTSSSSTLGGLWFSMSGGVVRRVTLRGANVSAPSYVGAVAGVVTNGARIEDVNVTESVITGNGGGGNDFYLGGIAGSVVDSVLYRARVDAVTVVQNGSDLGGLAGIVSGVNGLVYDSSSAARVIGTQFVGGLVGVVNESVVEKSWASGLVTSSGGTAGGLAGEIIAGGMISSSFAAGDVNVASPGTTAGGLVGSVSGTSAPRPANIFDCSASGSVTGSSILGGLVGIASTATVTAAFSTGTVQNVASSGGAIGSMTSTTATGVLFDVTLNAWSPSDARGTGKTTAQLKTAATYTTPPYYITMSASSPSTWFIVQPDGTMPPQPMWARCGDGVLEGIETCDDGNNTNGDGCSATCQIEGSHSQTPVQTTAPDGTTIGDLTGGGVYGVEFTPSADGWAFGFGGNWEKNRQIGLWDTSTGALLASTTLGPGFVWSRMSFAKPVFLRAGRRYTVGVYLPSALNGQEKNVPITLPLTVGNVVMNRAVKAANASSLVIPSTDLGVANIWGMPDIDFRR